MPGLLADDEPALRQEEALFFFFVCVAIGIREQAGGGKINTHARSWEDNSFSHLFLSVFDLYEIYISSYPREGLRAGAARVPGGGASGLANAGVGRAGEAVHGATGVSKSSVFCVDVSRKVPCKCSGLFKCTGLSVELHMFQLNENKFGDG